MYCLHVGDSGNIFKFTIVDSYGDIVDISSMTSNNVILVGPDGVRQIATCSLFTDGTDGILIYINTGNILLAGIWSIQVIVQLPGQIYHTNISNFRVENNLL